MPLITLTTDFGTRDHYAAAVKGELLKAIKSATIVDISHDITPFDIMHGSFVLKNSYHHFPDGTYHLIGVNMNSEEGISHLVVMKEQHIFIGPDNGIFGLLWDGEMPKEIFQLQPRKEESTGTLPMMDLYVRAVKHLSEGGKPNDIGVKVAFFRQSTMGRPIISTDYIRASIIYFDRFENAVVNIRKAEFESIQQNRKYVLYFKRYDDIDIIHDNYFHVLESEKICLFNSSGYLEIAINKGNAMGLLNLNVGDIVQIEFK
ncbi:MAG: SAM-dependent chlorinase/fluorinase [Chitinophagaceae bacterium]|nr:SAM-dependent chlorinase/fluorinase [Chitinophagaceae bacterium]